MSSKIDQIIHSILANEATDEEYHIFSEWIQADEENQKKYDQLKHLYQITSHRVNEKVFNTELAWQQVRRQTIDKKTRFNLPTWTQYAAIVAIIFSMGLFFFPKDTQAPIITKVSMEKFNQPTLLLDNGETITLNEESFSIHDKHVIIKNNAKNGLVYESGKEAQPAETIKNNHLIIPKGKTYQVSLSDGTRIWLNAETEIIYPTQFTGDKREVTLIGEAFFEVAKNKEIPFIVNANGMEVTVLGTSFNVSCYKTDNTLTTTLIEGSVSVKVNNDKTQTITPSEQFTYNKQTDFSCTQIVNTESVTSWIDGKYIFKEATLETIIKKLQRWHDFSVHYAEENLKYNRYSLTVERATDLDKLLEIISYTSNVKLERVNHIINIKKIEGGK